MNSGISYCEHALVAVSSQVSLTESFLFKSGAYPENHPTDNYAPFLGHSAKFVDPLVPVPSRIYSLRDERPLAGKRIAIKVCLSHLPLHLNYANSI